MAQLEPQQLTDLTNGLICEGAVSESQMPLNSVSESVNVHFDKIGSVRLRKGQTILGQQISSGTNILGLYEFRDSGSGTNNQIVAVNGTTLYYLSGSTWTSLYSSLSSGKKTRFATFLDYVFLTNGTDGPFTWNGDPSSGLGTTNVSSAPSGYFIEPYRDRLWIGATSTYPDRVYHSSIPTAVATPTISWNTSVSTGDWIDISPSDGENMTGLKRSKNALLVFKNNHIYRIYSINEGEPDPKISVGTYSNESIVEGKDGIYFHHPTGIYRYSDGSILDISQPVVDFIDNVSASNYDDICGWEDGNHVYHSVGNVTVRDITYSNVVLRYTISTKVWTVYSYPTQSLFYSKYNDGTTIFRLVGDNDGNILKTNTGNDDNGTPIFYSLITRPYTLDGLFSTRKNIQKMSIVHDKLQGGNIVYRVDDWNTNKWEKIGQIVKSIPGPVTVDIKGNKIWFRVFGTSTGEPFTFGGFELLNLDSELIG